MAMSSNYYAEGFKYILFPGNFGLGACGYNFPESTAQDDGGGAGNLSLSFSGSSVPLASNSPAQNFFYGPSGFIARYTPLAIMTGGPIQRFDYTLFRADTFGAPDLRTIYSVHTNAVTEAGYSERDKAARAFNTISQVNVLDLISEGPIEGFVSGLYIPNYQGKTTGDIGYTSVTFQPFDQIYSSPETRSIFWNNIPLTDLAGYVNFSFIDYKFTYGEKTNDHTVYNPYLSLYEERRDYFGRRVDVNKFPIQTSVTKSIGDSLYGLYNQSGNRYIATPKTYYIYNTDLSSIKINIGINSLYENVLTGDSVGLVYPQILGLKFTLYRVLKNGQLVLLDTSKYYPYTKDYYSKDEIYVQGKISQNPSIVTYEFMIKPYAENSPWFEIYPNQIGWAIDILKNTIEGKGGGLSNATSVHSITEVYSDRFIYPDSALVLSKFDARYFNEIPSRSYRVRLLKVKVPINYDPIAKTYNGPWDGRFKVAWTDNPAWCFYDILTSNRFGLGRYINGYLTDKWTLYEIAQYCDQLVSDGFGGLEPRFRCNLYIANKEEAYKVLNDMASLFNAIVYYSAGQITVSQDSLKDPIYLFNNSNVIDGDFNYSDASKKSRSTVAFVRFNDENDSFKPAIEYIEDKNSILKYGIREKSIVAFGCTSRNQARRMGKWLLTTENLETEMVNFRVGLEGYYLKPGDIISVFDEYRRNDSYAGRTLELNTGYAIIDNPYNSYNLLSLTGVNKSFKLNILTPSANLNLGTNLGDFYQTGFGVTSDGLTGLNSSFLRRSQIQTLEIYNPQLYVTSGSGVYSNNIKINFSQAESFKNNFSYTQPTMSAYQNRLVKNSSDGAWNAEAYSNLGFSKNVFARAKPDSNDKYVMFGLNSDPATDSSYISLDYAWYFVNNGTLQIRQNGNAITSFPTYNSNTILSITYDGVNVNYWSGVDNNVYQNLMYQTGLAYNANNKLFFDSSFYNAGAGLTVNFGTFGLDSENCELPANTIWNIDISNTGYGGISGGLNIRYGMNNSSNTVYPGYYLESYLNKPKKYRVLNITEEGSQIFNINALEYYENKFKDIDNVATLVNVPIKPGPPITPLLFTSGLFRDLANNSYCTTNPCSGSIYTTNQGGINSIIYNIRPTGNYSVNNLYYIYIQSGSNFSSATQTPESTLFDIISPQNLVTGLSFPPTDQSWQPILPPFFTPYYTGDYYLRVFAENTLGERSSYVTGFYRLTTQASFSTVDSSGRNVY